MESGQAAAKPHKRRLFKRTAKIVSAPGVLPEATGDQAVSIRVIQYDLNHQSDDVLTTSEDLASLLSRISDESDGESSKSSDGVTWINVDAGQNTSTLKIIGDAFDLHPLALEDVNNVHQRVKCEKYDDAMFFVSRMPQKTRPFDSEQISVFLKKGVVLTFQEHSGDCLDTVRERIALSTGRIRQRGADYLFYAILDRIVDEFFVTMEHYDEILGQFSLNIETTSQHDLPLKLHHVRDDLLQVRKITSQYREAFKRLSIDGSEILDADTLYFIRDCQDHISQLIEASDLGREYCGELRELHFAMLGQKSNDISKVLTLIATIFIPMSFISGVYGMNFDSQASSMNMP
ncbi:MAG: magnesium/cobalt transporter CorA, partial [Rubripirellula sp.]